MRCQSESTNNPLKKVRRIGDYSGHWLLAAILLVDLIFRTSTSRSFREEKKINLVYLLSSFCEEVNLV